MAILGVAIAAFLSGTCLRFSPETFAANLRSGYGAVDPNNAGGGSYNFWLIFAIYTICLRNILAISRELIR